MNGKEIRWRRFLRQGTGFGIIVPIDHGLTVGPIDGISTLNQLERWIGHSAISGLILHKGMVRRLAAHKLLPAAGLMVHLNGMTSLSAVPDRKELLTSVETALHLGADGVSIQLNFDGVNDDHNLILLGQIADQAIEAGLPLLTMLYDRVPVTNGGQRISRLRHLIRATIELGTDALKLSAPADIEEIPALLEGVHEDTPVFFAGGPVCSDREVIALAHAIVRHRAAGFCVGRNVFQRRDPGALLDQLAAVLYGTRAGDNGHGELRQLSLAAVTA
jgi:class I fructose-bisphosphate aldolase/fructose-bisphosphate aldolase/2-amino-3,7-dideoxy-D-threo-hept-6-ulosonate synthase